jgi:hypothetical protein
MTKSNTGNKSREKKVKVAGSNDVGVKISTRPRRVASKIREGSEMDLEDPNKAYKASECKEDKFKTEIPAVWTHSS